MLRSHRFLILAICFGLSLALSCNLPAQSDAVPEKETKRTLYIKLDFPGGSVNDFAMIWREACPELEISVEPSAVDETLGAIHFEGKLRDLFDVIRFENHYLVLSHSWNSRSGNAEVLIYSQPKKLMVKSLRALVAVDDADKERYQQIMSREEFMDAVNTAFEFFPRSSPPQFKFHGPTGLVFVYGAEEQLKVVSDVIQELQVGLQWGRGAQVDPVPTSR